MSRTTAYRRAARRVIRHFGSTATATLRRYTETIDDDTGEVSRALAETVVAPCAIAGIRLEDLKGTALQGHERRIFIPADAALASLDDDWTIQPPGGEEIEITSLRRVAPGGEPIYYEALVGGPGGP